MAVEGNVFSSLGINPIYIIGQIINFSLLLFLLKKFLYTPILTKLDERAKTVAKGIRTAEKNMKREEEIEKEKKEQLAKVKEEVAKMIENAKTESAVIKDEILAQAKSEAEKLMQKKQTEIEDLLQRQENELKGKISDLSVSIARKVLEEYLDKDLQSAVIESQMKKLAQIKLNK